MKVAEIFSQLDPTRLSLAETEYNISKAKKSLNYVHGKISYIFLCNSTSACDPETESIEVFA